MTRRVAAVSLVLVTGWPTPALLGQKPARSAAAAAGPRTARGSQPRAKSSLPRPGGQAVDRLSRMTPEEREKWLSSLPPARRQRIEQNLREFQKMTPAQQDRVRGRP